MRGRERGGISKKAVFNKGRVDREGKEADNADGWSRKGVVPVGQAQG
jgi:hypothetical protein